MAFKYKIDYRGNSKVIRRIVEKLNAMAPLGTSHDEAFYGDLGQIAYQHSQTKGNPHDLTLEDLGLEKITSQIQAMMEALGARVPWTRHTNEEEITTHDGEIIYFQTTARVLEYH
jgi:hypothetical protein